VKLTLTQHQEELHCLANALLEKETLTAEEVKSIIQSVEKQVNDFGNFINELTFL
jgi:ATP-dependent Zn protease